MKPMLITAVLAALAVAPTVASAQTPPPSQEQPQETKAPASPAGKWDVSLQTDQGAFPSTLDLKIEDKKVTGTMASERGTIPVEGEYTDGKLSFWLTVEGGGNSMTISFSGALQADGTMTGTADVQGYSMTWKATRAKSF